MKRSLLCLFTILALSTTSFAASAGASSKSTTTFKAPTLTPFCSDLHVAAHYESATLPTPLKRKKLSNKNLAKDLSKEAAAFAEAADVAPTSTSARQLHTTSIWLQAASKDPKSDSADMKKANAAFLAFTSSPKAAKWCSGY